MTENHLVIINRDCDCKYCANGRTLHSPDELEIEVEVTRGRAPTWHEPGEPDEGCVVSVANGIELTEDELDAAIELAISQPPPEAEDMRSLNFIDNEKPF